MEQTSNFPLKKISKGKVEYRYDTLTGQETRINPDRANRPKQGETDSPFEEVIKKSQEKCPFCPERIMEKVPKFPEQIAKDGRIVRGQTVIFPNLNPFGSNHAVGVISNSHGIAVDQFQDWMLKDTIIASQTFIQAVYAANNANKYPVFVWNFLPPSAGSIIHPHIQMLVEDAPVVAVQKRMKKCAKYFKTTKRNYFADLLETEKKLGERYLGGNESVHVITTFAPRGFNEVEFIFPGISSFTGMNEKQVADFADMLVRTLKGYKSVGVGSFNIASYSAGVNELREDFWFHVKLFSRPFPNGVYTNDTGPMERMYDSWVIDCVPEVLAQNLKPFYL